MERETLAGRLVVGLVATQATNQLYNPISTTPSVFLSVPHANPGPTQILPTITPSYIVSMDLLSTPNSLVITQMTSYIIASCPGRVGGYFLKSSVTGFST